MATFSSQVDATLRNSAVTQVAAGAWGVLVGMVFWLVLVSNPPTFATLAAALVILTGVVLTGALDVLSTASTRRLHTGLYFIGLLIGAVVMIGLLAGSIVDPLNIPASSASPAPS